MTVEIPPRGRHLGAEHGYDHATSHSCCRSSARRWRLVRPWTLVLSPQLHSIADLPNVIAGFALSRYVPGPRLRMVPLAHVPRGRRPGTASRSSGCRHEAGGEGASAAAPGRSIRWAAHRAVGASGMLSAALATDGASGQPHQLLLPAPSLLSLLTFALISASNPSKPRLARMPVNSPRRTASSLTDDCR